MAKEFSFKEARKLIVFYKKLLERLLKAIGYPSAKLKDIKHKFNRLKFSGYFSNLANHEIEGNEYIEKKDSFETLLLHIDSYIKGVGLAASCDAFCDDNYLEIKSRLNKLSPAGNPILWIFTSKKKKDEAVEQFNYLKDYQSSSLIDYAFKLLSDIDNLAKTDIADVKYDYNNQRALFANVISEADHLAFKDKNLYIEKYRNILAKNNSLISESSILRKAVKSAKDDIKKTIDYLVEQEFVNLLREIPIDEINRDKKGIRIKYLKECGYKNMADIYVASAYNLSSVYGISEDSAYTIKRLVGDYARKAQQGVKIKLSIDNKNKPATDIVRAIYVLRQINKLIDLINEQNKKHGPKIKLSFELLKTVGNGSSWPFLLENKKQEYKDTYSYLKETLFGEYGKVITNALWDYQHNKVDDNEENAWADFAENSIQFYNIIEDIYPGVLGSDDSIYGLPEDLAKEIQDECIFPDGLLCTLRRYQEWGVKYILHQEKVLLGDEMGLGKTVQAIAVMVSLKNTGATHFIVVCPASVLANWCREITKHSRLTVIKVHGYGKTSAFKTWLRNGGVAVTTYESAGIFKFNDHYKFSQLVVDEAHYIKNPDATRSKRVRALCEHADRILFMTGTALENKVDEMIELISILRLDIANKISKIAFMSTAPQFRQEIAPVYYRRKRGDVLTELPDLIESEEWCTLTPQEERVYEDAVLNKNYMEARRVSWNIEDIRYSSKAKRLLEIIEDAKNDGRKVLVFSFFLDTIRKIYDLLGTEVCLNPINGSINPNRRQEIIDEFDAAPAGTVLCAQIQSGGTGLNIQSASIVVICEPQFKPSIENQAISRAYRMGQSRNVQVFRLLCEDTIDEKMMNLLKAKQAVFDTFADKSVAAEKSLEIDDKTFGDLINTEIERIKAKNGSATPKQYESSNKSNSEAKEFVSFNTTGSKDAVNLEPIKTVIYDSSITYKDELNMSYKELVEHLLAKYGRANGDYFLTESCRSKNKSVSRSNEGLFCHHIDEDKAIKLSESWFASKNPFAYQKADRLCYCDILEHLILHIKIAEEPKNKDANKNEFTGIGGAVTFICRQINDCYSGRILTQKFSLRIKEMIKDSFDDYIMILQHLYDLIKTDPAYSILFSKDDICVGFDDVIVKRVYDAIH